MKTRLATLLCVAAIVVMAVGPAVALAAPPAIVYNSIPSPLPGNMASQPFQAQQAREFGDFVHLAGMNRALKTVTVTMSDWALYADYSSDGRYSGDSATWSHPITLNIYNVIPGTPNALGTLITTKTQNATIPWRPVADPTCPTPTAWRALDGNCYNGMAFNITFDLSSLNVSLPNDIVVGVAYNTQTYGLLPIGVGGPYDSLNVGAVGSATVGTDGNTNRVFFNTLTAGWYADGGVGGVGTFREDYNWGAYGTVPMQITAGPVANTTVVVTPAAPHGWYFYDDDYPGGVGTFVTGPATPPAGTGSARMEIPLVPGTARETITTLAHAGTRFDKITRLEYSTSGSVSTLQFNVDFDLTDSDNTTWMGRLVYVPSGGVTSGGWTKWDPMSGMWWTTAGAGKAVVGGVGGTSPFPQGSPCTWATFKATYPNAGIRLSDGGIHLKAGGPAAGFDGNVDAFTVGVDFNNTTYDFEPGAGGAALTFVPEAVAFASGANTVIGVNLNNVANLYGYQFQVAYDPSVVAAHAWFGDAASNGEPLARLALPLQQFFKTASDASIPGSAWNANCAAGVCKFAVSKTAVSAISGSGLLAYIVLTGQTPGTFNLSYSADTLADRNGGLIAHTIGTSAITVYGMATVQGTANLQGRTDRFNAGTVTLTDPTGTFGPFSVPFSEVNGAYNATVPALAGGTTYNVTAAHSLYLTNATSVSVLPAGVTLATTTLPGGDADDNGTIELLDLSTIGTAFGQAPAAGRGTGADINADSIVNILDLVLAGGNYGQASPQGW